MAHLDAIQRKVKSIRARYHEQKTLNNISQIYDLRHFHFRVGLVTRMISNEKKVIITSASLGGEKENVLGPIVAGCVVAIVVVTIIMLLASWDRVERRMRSKYFF